MTFFLNNSAYYTASSLLMRILLAKENRKYAVRHGSASVSDTPDALEAPENLFQEAVSSLQAIYGHIEVGISVALSIIFSPWLFNNSSQKSGR
jgi:hypothetical protein